MWWFWKIGNFCNLSTISLHVTTDPYWDVATFFKEQHIHVYRQWFFFLSKPPNPPKSISVKCGPPSLSPWIQKHLESDELCYVTTLSRLNTHFLYTITTPLHRCTLPAAPHPNMFVSELSLSKQTLPSCYNCMHTTDG